MMMTEAKHNLNYIKKKLQSYQLSTVTSGLNGDDRYEELKYRLESYEKQLEQLEELNRNGSIKQQQQLQHSQSSNRSISSASSGSRVNDSTVESNSFQVPSLNSLSIGDVRARLAALGENTNTPGLTGEERRNALVKRLIDAAYSKTDDSVLEVLITANNNNYNGGKTSKVHTNYSDDVRRDNNNALVDYTHMEVMNSHTTTSTSSQPSAHSSPPTGTSLPSTTTTSTTVSPPPPQATTKVDIHSLKKELKRISNQRAILIASRLSGTNQDIDLKLSELRLVKVDHELNTWRSNANNAATQRGDKKIVDLKKFNSDFVKLSSHDKNKNKNHGDRDDRNSDHDDRHGDDDVAQVLLVEDLILELEEHKKGVKEEIRAHRARIRAEVEQHSEFGVDKEQAISKLLKEINLQKPTHIAGANVEKSSNVSEVNLQRPFIMDGASVQRPSVVSGIDDQRQSSLVGRTKQKIQEIISFAQDAANNNIDDNDSNRDDDDDDDDDDVKDVEKNDDMNIYTAGNSRNDIKATSLNTTTTTTATTTSTTTTTTSTTTTTTTALRKVSDSSTPGLMLKSSFLDETIDMDFKKDNIKSNVYATATASKAITTATSVVSASVVSEEKYSRHHNGQDVDRYDDGDDHDESDSYDDYDEGDNISKVIDSNDHGRADNIFYNSSSSNSSVVVVTRQPPAMKITASTMSSSKNCEVITGVNVDDDDHDDDDDKHYDVDDHHNYIHDNDLNNTNNDGEKEKYGNNVVENESIEVVEKIHKNKLVDGIVDLKNNNDKINNGHNDDDDSDNDDVDVDNDDNKTDNQFQDNYFDENRNDNLDHNDDNSNDNNNHNGDEDNVDQIDNEDHVDHDDNEGHVDRDGDEDNVDQDDNEDHVDHDGNEGHVDHDDNDDDYEQKQIKLLLHQAKQLKSSSDIDEADSLYQQALELDPMNISSLVSYASFLHQRKGELARAEAFYNRCLQVYLPGVVLKKVEETYAFIERGDDYPTVDTTYHDTVDEIINHNASVIHSSMGKSVRDDNDVDDVEHHHGGDDDNHSDDHPNESTAIISNVNQSIVVHSIHSLVLLNNRIDETHHHHGISTKSDISSSTIDNSKKRFKLRHVINFLLSYANFMNKSKGDIESSILLYQKGVELSPTDGHLLATYAHFLSSIGQSMYNQQANKYFQKALQLSPGKPQYTLWYAKLLKKMGQWNKAELMYKVSLDQSKMYNDIEPIAICNYATFLFKIRKDVIKAKTLFEMGLSIYPNHKGLKKNYRCLVNR